MSDKLMQHLGYARMKVVHTMLLGMVATSLHEAERQALRDAAWFIASSVPQKGEAKP